MEILSKRVLTKTVPQRGLINYFRTNYQWTWRTLHGSLWMDAFLLNGMYIEDILILEEMSVDALIFVPKRQGMISWCNSNVCNCCKFWIEVYLTETVVYIWVQLEIYIKAWNILSFNCWTPYCIIFIEIWGSDICLFKKKFIKKGSARYKNSKSVIFVFSQNRWG